MYGLSKLNWDCGPEMFSLTQNILPALAEEYYNFNATSAVVNIIYKRSFHLNLVLMWVKAQYLFYHKENVLHFQKSVKWAITFYNNNFYSYSYIFIWWNMRIILKKVELKKDEEEVETQLRNHTLFMHV